ncbi:AIPR family protein [Spirochaeta lutea]|uniref:Abortive phage infection protein C-terminal domain-containing protein n=1 Tax=Spirochaeta lutea TaxID=1480694 RepID=A0A098R319_9SPIO|nr:AIPR family protein [Spirochaeta lutea]KGE73132.1 hypothetical protein DC28_04900 [Spirochaeta lutea]
MDRITKGMLEEFVKENSLSNFDEATAFEHFTGALLVAEHYSESFSSDDIHIGAGGDTGIDSIAILINGALITDIEEIDELLRVNGYLDVSFIFVQSERSQNFDMQKLGHFGFGVSDLFSERPTLPHNEKIELKFQIANELFSKSSKFKRGNPKIFLYYITTGKWGEDTNLNSRRESVITELSDLSLFSDVKFECKGAKELHSLYRNSKNAIQREIIFPNKTALPDLSGVEQAYIGYLDATEYLKLIQNENKEIISSLFYDNVRHWQAWNPVNKEIRATIEDSSKKEYFPLLNNGVTIVAKALTPTGNKLTIEDYQIVNGCQTSHVLHELNDSLDNTIHVPVRIIATKEPEIKNSIIKATNRQTEVSDDQLIALSDFPRKLEDFFPSYDKKNPLFYERRSKQYDPISGIEKVRIITMPNMIRAFAAIFLELPHSTTRNYASLLKMLGEQIFNDEHRLEMYYFSALAYYRIEFLFRSQAIEPKLKPARFHILLAVRLIMNKSQLPRKNSREMERYCLPLIKDLSDETKYKRYFNAAVQKVESVAAGNFHRDNIRTEAFTTNLINEIGT